ncbi:Zinc finger, RING/FYVE/PHD-type, partial [Nannochloropsis gaditana]
MLCQASTVLPLQLPATSSSSSLSSPSSSPTSSRLITVETIPSEPPLTASPSSSLPPSKTRAALCDPVPPPSPSSSVHCLCRGPDDGSLMVECGSCLRWFHLRCLSPAAFVPVTGRKEGRSEGRREGGMVEGLEGGGKGCAGKEEEEGGRRKGEEGRR